MPESTRAETWPDPEVIDPVLDEVRWKEGKAGEDYVLGLTYRHGRETFTRIVEAVRHYRETNGTSRKLGHTALLAITPGQLSLFG